MDQLTIDYGYASTGESFTISAPLAGYPQC